jgi:hypothetical protein
VGAHEAPGGSADSLTGFCKRPRCLEGPSGEAFQPCGFCRGIDGPPTPRCLEPSPGEGSRGLGAHPPFFKTPRGLQAMNEDPRPGGCIAQQMVAMRRSVDHLRLAPIDPPNCTTPWRHPCSLRPQALSERSESGHRDAGPVECQELDGCRAVSRLS